MRKMILTLALALLGAQAHAIDLNCTGQDGKLGLSIDRAQGTVAITDREALGDAQVPKGPTDAKFSRYDFSFEYKWYYVAQYDFALTKNIADLKAGDKVQLLLNGDDADGANFENVNFECSVSGN